MVKTKMILRFALVLCTVLLAVRAFGSINSTPDGTRHPALGSVCYKLTEIDSWSCLPASGVLVAPDVVLTSAHAGPWLDTVKPAKLGITFDEKITSNVVVYEVAQFVPDPLFAWDTQDPHDLAVFIMRDKLTTIHPFRLPPVLDMLANGNLVPHTYFTVVDRGLTTLTGYPDYPVWTSRVFGETVATELRPGAIMLGSNAKHPTQVCIGGSGSVALLTNTDIAVGVGSWFSDWPDGLCNGPVGYNRLDTWQARNFLQNYLPWSLLPH